MKQWIIRLWRRPGVRVLALLLLAWLVRHGVALLYGGHWGDMVTFKSWALRMATFGPNRFFLLEPGQPPGIPCDYPPLYPYLLGVLGQVYQAFADGLRPEQSGWFTLLIKSPAILLELAVGWLVYRILREAASIRVAIAGASLTLFNPALIADTAGAGQINPFVAVLQLLALWGCSHKRYGSAILLTALAILLKPQGVVLAPLIGFLAVRDRAWRAIALAGLASFLLALALTAPYLWNKLPLSHHLLWLWHHYLAQAQLYPFSSAMAFNIWAPWGYWDQLDGRSIAGLPHRIWGLLLFGGAYLGALTLLLRGKASIWQAATLVLLAFFLFPTRMHERYLYYALVLLGLLAASRPAWRIPWAWFSFSFLLNLTYVLVWPFPPGVHAWLENGGDQWVAGINVAMFGYCALLAMRPHRQAPPLPQPLPD